jgi:hypothetical protein
MRAGIMCAVGGSPLRPFFVFHPRITAHATTPNSPTQPTVRLAIKTAELSALLLSLTTAAEPALDVVGMTLAGQ